MIRLRNIWNEVRFRVWDYFQNTTIHGLRYIVSKDTSYIEKLFWLVVCCSCLFGTYLLFKASLHQFRHNAVSFVTDTTYLNWNTTFPAISVCEVRSEDKLEQYAEYYFGRSRDRNLDSFLEDIVFFDGVCQTCVHHCSNTIQCPTDIDYYVKQIRSSCQDLLGRCSWNGQPFNCCSSSMFEPLETELGICYTINSIQIPVRRVSPLIVNQKLGSGTLKFDALENVKIFIHTPEDVPFFNQQDSEWWRVEWGHNFDLMLLVNEITNDPHLSEVPIESRNCRLPSENYIDMYPYYSYSACIVECRRQYQLKACGCTHHLMPDKGKNSSSTCTAEGLACLTQHEDELRYLKMDWFTKPGLICDCIPSCTEAEYQVVYEEIQLKSYFDPSPYTSTFQLQVGSLPTLRFQRNVVRTKLDLVVSMGGAAGLFLGASLLSTFELFYFFCFRRRKLESSIIMTSQETSDTEMSDPQQIFYLA